MDTTIHISFSSIKLFNLKHDLLSIFPHKCYNSRAITPARIHTIYVRSIYGVQSVITRFHNKFYLILEVDCFILV